MERKKAEEELRLKMERVMLVLRGNSEAATREMAFGSWAKAAAGQNHPTENRG